MQFQFDARQEFQLQAIEAVADLFVGQTHIDVGDDLKVTCVANRLDLDPVALLSNLRSVQERNGIPPSDELEIVAGETDLIPGVTDTSFCNFSVEMETGTGKTYVYLRTALELFRRYGLRKFIVVVPSVAIREGVLQTLRATGQHLRELYANVPYRYYAYDSAGLSQVRQFALSDSVEMMVMTLDSFNKASNVIRQSSDRLAGDTPVSLIQSVRPILILDEPQNMESDLSRRSLLSLHPLFALRYSATHRNPYNLVYRLTPFEAYRQHLVKKLEVAEVVRELDANQVFVQLREITAKKQTLRARLAVHKLMADGSVREHALWVGPGDSLRKATGRPDYEGYDVDEISAAGGFVRFANDIEITLGESRGADKEAIFREQIAYTVEEHLRKQARLRPSGIKVLSLFFIDRVDNYAPQGSLIRRLFAEEFDRLKAKQPAWREVDAAVVQAAYFAQKRRKDGHVDFLQTRGESREDEIAYNLIMRDKERLLSFDEPAAFIFSHSALREGWDNSNVFQICTLNQSVSEMRKRQEIGRGMRLARNQDGAVVRDEYANVLTVVANESYDRYVSTLQAEIHEEYGPDGAPPKPANARKRGVATLNKQRQLSEEFKELWERIRPKTRYAVRIDSDALLADVIADLATVTIAPPRIGVAKATVEVDADDRLTTLTSGARRLRDMPTGQGTPAQVLDLIAHLMQFTSPPVRLSRATYERVLAAYPDQPAALANPYGFASEVARLLKGHVADVLVNGIQYVRSGEYYDMAQWDVTWEAFQDALVPTERGVYDHAVCESGVEEQFARDLDARPDVRVFAKLPGWFTVPTPVGDYNPDWAIVMEDRDEHGDTNGRPLLCLVRETKGSAVLSELRPDERRKVQCGARHFADALGVDYRVVTRAADAR